MIELVHALVGTLLLTSCDLHGALQDPPCTAVLLGPVYSHLLAQAESWLFPRAAALQLFFLSRVLWHWAFKSQVSLLLITDT